MPKMRQAKQQVRNRLTYQLSFILVYILIILFGIVSVSHAGQAILSWDPPATNTDGSALTDLAGYKIYYGTSSGNYSTVITVGNVTTYTITGLTDNITYYFATTAYDSSGNESAFSNEVSKTISASSDVTAPIISNVTTSSISGTSATISWSTNEVSSSQAEFGTSTSYGSSTTIDNTLVTSHTVTVSGLTSWTTYHFRVKSQDGSGNLTVSSDFTFTTIAPPDTTLPTGTILINGNATYTSSASVTLTLSCSDGGTGCSQMQFSNDGTTWSTLESFAATKSWTLSGGQGSKTVYARYRDSAGNTSTNYTDTISLDSAAPVLSSIGTSGLSNNSVTITWTTVEVSTSQVEYGTTTTYGSSSPLYNNSVTSHSVTLNNLSATTTYHFRVKSTDAAGNLATSGDYTFTTAAPPDTTAPVISGVGTGNITTTGVTITWTTNEASSSQAEFGTTTAYGSSSTLDNNSVTSHSVTLNNLSATTTYHFRVKSTDAAGNLVTSGDYTFTTATPPDTTAPVISSVGAGNMTTTGVTITWTTNEASTSKVEYGTSQTYGSQSNVDNTLVTAHTVVLSGLTPNTIYYFRVISSDQAGNQGISAGSNFTTQKVAQPDTPTAIQDITVRVGASTRNSVILDWTATGADGIEGTASAYDLRMSAQKIIENGVTAAQGEINFSNAVPVTGVPAPKAAGSTESVQVGQLVTNSVYYFAIKAVDEKGNVSGISNVSNSTNLPPLPVTAIRQGYTMISLPLATSTTDVQTLFSGIVGTTAELYWWSSNGLGGSDGAFIAETNVVAGYGYMLKSDTANAVLNITGTAITDPSRAIPLQPGWNMIGNPYSSEVAIRNTYVRRVSTGELKSYENAVIAGWLGNSIYNFNGSTYDFSMYTDATLKLWQGYWVSILQGDQYELIMYKP